MVKASAIIDASKYTKVGFASFPRFSYKCYLVVLYMKKKTKP